MVGDQIIQVIDNINKPGEDKRHYKGLVLKNGLKVVLISDPETDISAAALDVGVGSMSDPKEIPGLAHFLEHMLFLGTEKYPEENDYHQYITRNGGHTNAYTARTHTNFQFDISTDHLSGALDRFAQFFICPLMTESATQREMNAVDKEYQRDRDLDGWRTHLLSMSLMDPEHDYTKFEIGNLETLRDNPSKAGIDVRKALLEFHDKWFSANIMSLVVLGKESLEELTQMVVPLFTPIKNKQVAEREWPEHPLSDDYLRKQISIVPLFDYKWLELTFPIPDLTKYYKSKPSGYLSHLIGHEGTGSLLSELKKRGLCTQYLGAGAYTPANGFAFFTITCGVTVDGTQRIDEIITLTFQYINMLKKEGPKQWIFEENKRIKDIDFRFREKDNPIVTTRTMAANIRDYPMNDLITGPALLEEFRPELVGQVLDLLTPDNMVIKITDKNLDKVADKQEKWFGAHYKVDSISQERIDLWNGCGLNDRFCLPLENEFIASDLSIKKRGEDRDCSVPRLIKNTKLSRVWYLQDSKYKRPLANYIFKLIVPSLGIDPFSAAVGHLIDSLLSDGLNEYCYGPGMAGLNWNIWSYSNIILFRFSGYNEKLTQFMDTILGKVRNFRIDPQRFEVFKEQYFRYVRTHETYDLLYRLHGYSSRVLSERYWTEEEVLDIESDVTIDSIQHFMAKLWSRFHIEALIHGNVSRTEAEDVIRLFESHFSDTKPIPVSQQWRNREIQLPDGSNLYFAATNSVHQTNAIRVYLQIGVEETANENCLLEFFIQLIKEKFFTELRTKQQLGYATFASLKRNRGVQGLAFTIQSDYSPEYLDERIEAFLAWTKEYLLSMTSEVFESERQSLITRIQESPKKLFRFTDRLWTEIGYKTYHFTRVEVEVATIRAITKEDVIKFYDKYVSHESPNRKKLSVRISSAVKACKVVDTSQTTDLYRAPLLKNCEQIRDIQDVKDLSSLYALPRPYINVNEFDGIEQN